MNKIKKYISNRKYKKINNKNIRSLVQDFNSGKKTLEDAEYYARMGYDFKIEAGGRVLEIIPPGIERFYIGLQA